MDKDRRLTQWIDLVGDLLQRPLAEFPVAEVACALNSTFDVRGVSWDWRDRSGRAGFESWPDLDVSHFPPPAELQELYPRHPLIQWFTTTRDPKPQSTGRVPQAIAPGRDRLLVQEILEPLDFEQQLAIPYVLDGVCYEAFVLGRPNDEYDACDLELACSLQRLIRGLYLHTSPVATDRARADAACASAERIGLTATEQAVLVLLVDGHTTYGIARRLEMAPRTASKHLEHIYRKLDVTHRVAAVNAAHEAGLVGRRPGSAHTP